MLPGPAKLSLCYSSGLTVEALEGDVVPVDVTLERRLVREDEAALLARHLQQQQQNLVRNHQATRDHRAPYCRAILSNLKAENEILP